MTVTHQKPVIIRRMSDLRDNHMTLGLFYLECDRWREIKPQSWLAEGKPDLNYVEQKLSVASVVVEQPNRFAQSIQAQARERHTWEDYEIHFYRSDLFVLNS